MGLPSLESARTWGGKLLVDRDGTEIGTCTEIFVDDATGLPEWAAADVSGGPALVPLLDATQSGDRVQVAVRHADVAGAPSLGHGGHMSEAEEAQLYRHYGIEASREASESLLPAPDAEPASAPAAPPEVADVPAVPAGRGARLRPALAASGVGALAVVAAVIFWWRQRRQVPPTRKELLAARARAASLAVDSTRQRLVASAAPVVRSGRQLSAAAARNVTLQVGAAAERAAALALAARTFRR